MSRNHLHAGKFAVYSDCQSTAPMIDLHREIRGKNLALAGSHFQTLNAGPSAINTLAAAEMLDFVTWLPHAAAKYKISKDPRDYLLKPFVIMTSDLPNRNGIGFPRKELLEWDTEAMRQRYKMWKGAPNHLEHNNSDYSIANGLVADCMAKSLRQNPSLLKIIVLMALDRTRYPSLTAMVQSGEMNAVSMGAWCDSYTCSKCGKEVGSCMHMRSSDTGSIIVDNDRELVYAQVKNIQPFEVSWVGTPAYSVAVNDDALLSLT